MTTDPEGDPVLCVDAADLPDDAVTLDSLARFALMARRCGYRILVRRASPNLAALIELAGLSEVLPLARVPPGPSPPRG